MVKYASAGGTIDGVLVIDALIGGAWDENVMAVSIEY